MSEEDKDFKSCYKSFKTIFNQNFWIVAGVSAGVAAIFGCISNPCFMNFFEKTVIIVCTILALRCVSDATQSYEEKISSDLQKNYYEQLKDWVHKNIPHLKFCELNEVYISFGKYLGVHYEIRKDCGRHKKFELRLDFEDDDEKINIEKANQIKEKFYKSAEITKSGGEGIWRRIIIVETDDNVPVDDAGKWLKACYDKTHEVLGL